MGPAQVRLSGLGSHLILSAHNRGLLGSGRSRLVHRFVGLVHRGGVLESRIRGRLATSVHSFIMTGSLLGRTFVRRLFTMPTATIRLSVRRGGVVDIIIPRVGFSVISRSSGSASLRCNCIGSGNRLSSTVGGVRSVLPGLLGLARVRGAYRLLTSRVRGAEEHMGTLRCGVVPRLRRAVHCVRVGLRRGRQSDVIHVVGIGSVNIS